MFNTKKPFINDSIKADENLFKLHFKKSATFQTHTLIRNKL